MAETGVSSEIAEGEASSEQDLVALDLKRIQAARGEEKDWRKLAQYLFQLYRNEKKTKKRSVYNIFWANTETLRPAIYAQTPKPDVRRRFRDPDPIAGKASTVLERALAFSNDTQDFDQVINLATLDYLITGRGVTRVRYVPELARAAKGEIEVDGDDDPIANDDGELGTAPYLSDGGQPTTDKESLDDEDDDQPELVEEMAWQSAVAEHVNWDDFCRGPGRNWDEVEWIAFRHRMTREEGKAKFQTDLTLDFNAAPEGERDNGPEKKGSDTFKRAVVWEIWDKAKGEVRFVAPANARSYLKVETDPPAFDGFYPIPRPLYSVEDSDSLVPVPEYELYREQAEELNIVSKRIMKLVGALRYRGIYDASLPDLSTLFTSDDADMVPATNVAKYTNVAGGLQNAIWLEPVERMAPVLTGLYQQRDQIIRSIQQITGISDIQRGETKASETLGAQQLKAQYSSIRLVDRQKEVQRYVRNIVRLKAQIIAHHFTPETLKTMTGVKMPDAMTPEIEARLSMGANGGPPMNPPPVIPTWDNVMGMLRDDALRTFAVDIETDSTIATDLNGDRQGLAEVLTSIENYLKGIAPFVKTEANPAGFIPLEAAKAMLLSVVRHSRMGRDVEDALDQISGPMSEGGENGMIGPDGMPMAPKPPAPPPPPPPEVLKAQADAQAKAAQEQTKQAEINAQMQRDAAEAQQRQIETAVKERVRMAEIAAEQAAAEREMAAKAAIDKYKIDLDAATKVAVASISAGATPEQAMSEAMMAISLLGITLKSDKKIISVHGRDETGRINRFSVEGQ